MLCVHENEVMFIKDVAKVLSPFMTYIPCLWAHPGGGTSLFSGRGVRPGFLKCGAICLWKGGACELKISKIWLLVNWKFPNLGACELKISKFGAWELKFGRKLRLLRLKFPNFLKRGSCELTLLLLEMGPLRTAGEEWKGVLQGRTPPYPLSRSVPPGELTGETEFPSNHADGKGLWVAKGHKVRILCLHAYILYPQSQRFLVKFQVPKPRRPLKWRPRPGIPTMTKENNTFIMSIVKT